MGAPLLRSWRRGRGFATQEDLEWKWDMDELNEAVTKDTQMILVCNPNNPTGRLYDLKEQKAIAEIAQDADAVLLSDESFRGLELDAPSMSSTPFVNLYYNAVSVGSMSKPFTADGVRLGWAVAQNNSILAKAAAVQDISIEHVGMETIIAWAANEPETFKRIVSAHRNDAVEKRKVLADWMAKQSFFTSWVKAKCGFLSFPGWTHDISSLDFVNAVWRAKKLVFMPGQLNYGVEHHVRFGTGRCTMEEFKTNIQSLGEFLEGFK